MPTLAEIESAILQLSPAERVKLSAWWQEHIDPDAGLQVSDDTARELDTAKGEIAHGDIAPWDQIKLGAKSTPQ